MNDDDDDDEMKIATNCSTTSSIQVRATHTTQAIKTNKQKMLQKFQDKFDNVIYEQYCPSWIYDGIYA